MSALADVLKTEDEAEQVQVVEKLIEMAKAPVSVMTLAFDARTGKMSIIANQLNVEAAYQMLELARQELLRMERDSLRPKEQPEAPVK